MDQPRFIEVEGGRIRDRITGYGLASVNIEGLKTADAQRVVAAIIDGLHREFGPIPSGQRPMPTPKK